jgi:hypothetical protein
MGMDAPQKSNPSIHVNTIYTLRRGKIRSEGMAKNSADWQRDYRAGERALNLSDSSSALDVCPHLEHW